MDHCKLYILFNIKKMILIINFQNFFFDKTDIFRQDNLNNNQDK